MSQSQVQGEGESRPPGPGAELQVDVYTGEHIPSFPRTPAWGAVPWKLPVPAPVKVTLV